MVRPPPTGLRCAIYTRKSSEEGLDQAFNSLHAQREACEAYVTSQRHQGWQLIETAYDDGGLSGGTMARPALQRLLAEIQGRRIDIVLVYKVDRLTRSLADFARIVETFDAHDVSFVSVTQQFNTTTSMGRLTLNMLLSFAQFEREVTGERIRDKIAASRARGLWMGGHVPLGYDLQARCLVANPDEAAIVRLIFARYVELGSVASLKARLDARGIVSKARISATGRSFGGKPFSRGALYRLLANRLYIGQAVHKGRAHPGAHEAIIERALFEAAQATLKTNRITRTNGRHADEPSLLGGLLVDPQGERMTPSHAVKNCKRYRYYVSQALLQQRARRTGHVTRIPAHEIEALVVTRIQALLHDPGALLDLLSDETPDLPALHALLAAAAELARRWPTLAPAALRGFVRAITKRVVVHTDHLNIVLSPDRLRAALRTNPVSADPPDLDQPYRAEVTLTVDARLKRCGGETKLIVPAHAAGNTPPRPNPTLLKALARAHSWVTRLLSGQASSIRAIAQAEGLTARYVARIVPLAFLAPDITEAMLEGTQPQDLTLAKLCQRLPLAWPEERRTLGFDPAFEHRRSPRLARPRPAHQGQGAHPATGNHQ
jgi:DNA invertase Pin-like site-specific DNA recombinase